MKIVVASGNRHKIEEIAAGLGLEGVEFVGIFDLQPDFVAPEEDADTFVGNAKIKAQAAFKASELPSLADDSGLVVDALKSAPGVNSARYAGENASDSDNNAKLLRELTGIPASERSARFVSVLALVGLDMLIEGAPHEIFVEGACEGSIETEARGEQGFGYDPLFQPLLTPGRRMAELSMDEKNEISHRGVALKELSLQISGLL